jgi:hypothetical protein
VNSGKSDRPAGRANHRKLNSRVNAAAEGRSLDRLVAPISSCANAAARHRDRDIGDRGELHELEFAAHENVRRQRPIQSSADRVAPEQRIVLAGAIEEQEILASGRSRASIAIIAASTRKGRRRSVALRHVGEGRHTVTRSPYRHADKAVGQEIADDIARATAGGAKVGCRPKSQLFPNPVLCIQPHSL